MSPVLKVGAFSSFPTVPHGFHISFLATRCEERPREEYLLTLPIDGGAYPSTADRSNVI